MQSSQSGHYQEEGTSLMRDGRDALNLLNLSVLMIMG